MLEHVGLGQLARQLRTAITETLNTDHICTRDLKGTASTSQFADAVVRRIAIMQSNGGC
jgi:isocitrate dehydrogenase (NAD+)